MRSFTILFALPLLVSCQAAMHTKGSGFNDLGADERIENFDYLWRTFDRKYCYFNFKHIDWNDLYARYRPQVEKCRSDDIFFRLLENMTAELQDEHVWIFNPLRNHFLHGSVDFDVALIEGRCVVAFVPEMSESFRAGIRAGMEILSMDGKTLEECERELDFLIPDHREINRKRAALWHVCHNGKPGDSLRLELRTFSGKTLDVLLPLSKRRVRPWCAELSGKYLLSAGEDMQYVKYGRLGNGIGYIRVSQWKWEGGRWKFFKLSVLGTPAGEVANEFERALEALKDAPGLVFDLRGNEGGGEPPARYAAARFVTGKTLEGYYDYRDGEFEGKEAVWIEPGGKWQYKQPVVLLINHRNCSTSESFVATMKQLSHVTVIGDTTAGVTGVPRTDELPCGAKFIYSTGMYYLPDGTIPEWTGIPPDIAVQQTVEDLKTGRDTVLDYAIEYLEKRIGPLPNRPSRQG